MLGHDPLSARPLSDESATGSAAQTLTQSAILANSNTFFTHTLSATIALTQTARFDNTNTFFTHTLTAGPAQLTQSARFDNANSFFTHTLTPGAVALTQTTRFDNSNAFFTHTLSASIGLVQSARFDNSNSFFTHALTPGAVALTQTAIFENVNTFFTHSLSQTGGGAQSLTQDTRFDNANAFFTHTLTTGFVALTQTDRFDNENTFFAHVLSQVGGPEPSQTRGTPGRRHRYVAFINGQRYVGDLVEIQELVEQFAESQATKAITAAKAPKKPRIVVQPGKTVDKAPAVPSSVALQVQKDVRDLYDRAYAQAMLDIEQDEEEALMVLLS